MGKTYLHECDKCGYRCKVAGGRAEGRDLLVQTICCKDCRALYDVVVALRSERRLTLRRNVRSALSKRTETAPTVESALRRLRIPASTTREWREFPLACPVSPLHRISEWKSPGRCPRCGAYLEQSALPYRVWE